MCEEADLKSWAKDKALSRRQFGILTGAAAVAACAPGDTQAAEASSAGKSSATDLTETAVTFETTDGTMDAVFIHPKKGKNPGVIFWPDIASIRETKRKMARALASEGYAVLILNPYYRDVAGEQFTGIVDFFENDGFPKVTPWREKHDADSIGRDAVAAAAWLDEQDAVDTARGIGTQGYCMGGPFTIWSAAAVPGRIKAAASFHGGGLVRDDYDKSPHKLLGDTDAAFLIAVAKDDDAKAPEEKTEFTAAAKAAGKSAVVDVYEGDHGWTVADAPSFAQEAADKAFADLLTLYSKNL